MVAVRGLPTLGPVLHHDWTRRYFRRPLPAGTQEETERAASLVPATSLELALASGEGVAGCVLVTRPSPEATSRRRMLIWHGAHRLVEETFQGWFGPRVQRVRGETFRLLLERLDHFLVLDASTQPTFVIPLASYNRLGVSLAVLESVLGAPVRLAAEAPFAGAAYVPSLRVFVRYDGARYQASARKVFYDPAGSPVAVEWVARDVLRRLGYDVVNPALFSRLFFALVGRPPSHFHVDTWPKAFVNGRLSPLEWVARGAARIEDAARRGMRTSLVGALEELGKRRPYRDFARPEGALPLVASHTTRRRLESLIEALGDQALATLFRGFLTGYRPNAADWFAWEPGGGRAFFCEIKSLNDHLRETQKDAILWCQRTGALDYRLLEILHNPDTNGAPAAST